MPPKKNKQGNVKKKRGKNLKRKRHPWDSGDSDEEEQFFENYNHYDDEPRNSSSDSENGNVSEVEEINLNKPKKIKIIKPSLVNGLEPEENEEEDGIEEIPDNVSELSASQHSSTTFSFLDTIREKRCVWLEDREIPRLDLPASSEDLLLMVDKILPALEIYEVCRRFGCVVRLSPFLFEDFCASLAATNEQSPLLDEIHMSFLKLLLKEDDNNQTIYGGIDMRDSINLSLYFLDSMTYGEILRRYVESDERFGVDVRRACSNCNYPYVDVERRLTVLTWLCNQFLTTSALKNELSSEGVIKHDDHCRECGKPGDLLCCDTCSAVFHLACVDPPLMETPSSGWQCVICTLHKVPGVTDCVSELEKIGQLIRQGFLGFDRHGRRYWFIARRIFVEDENTKQVWYYSTLAQFRQLLTSLDANDFENDLCETLSQFSKEILHQLDLNEELTDARKNGARQTWFAKDKTNRPWKQQQLTTDATNGDESTTTATTTNNPPTELLFKVNNMLNECDELLKKFNVDDDARVELEDVVKLKNDYVRKIKEDDDVTTNSNADNNLFKLGMDRAFLKYENLYSTNALAKNPYLRAEDRKWDKYMANRFNLDGDAEFNWPKETFNSSEKCARVVRNSLITLSSRLPAGLMHPLWVREILPTWKQNLTTAARPSDFAKSFLEFEANVKPIVFNDSWKHSLGHSKLWRQTVEDKEEKRTKDKLKQKKTQTLSERLTASDPTDEDSSVVWVKYSLLDGPPKHEIWKLKDELYRVNGFEKLGGWLWVKRSRVVRHSSFRNYGVYAGPAWQSTNASAIEQMLYDLRNGLLEVDKNNDEEMGLATLFSSSAADEERPLCDELPMQMNENTLELEIDRSQAAKKLELENYVDSIDVSRALTRHSLYYKIAKGSKILDGFLSARLKQEKENDETNDLSSRQCYSSLCRRTNDDGVVNFYSCYSSTCRQNNRCVGTRGKHRLKFVDTPSKSTTTTTTNEKFLRTPPVHYYKRKGSQEEKKYNILILPKHVVRKLARNSWRNDDISGFNNNCKGNPTFWPYPCARPFFYICWRYQMAKSESLHAVALMFRVLFACVRWTDVMKNISPDAKRTRRLEDFTETREIVKHKNMLPFGLTACYMMRVVNTPNDYQLRNDPDYDSESSDEDYDPHNNTPWKLRERRDRLSNKPKKNTCKPTVRFQWLSEEDLVIWEVRNYWSNLEKRRKLREYYQPGVGQVAGQIRTPNNITRMPGITVKSNIIRQSLTPAGQQQRLLAPKSESVSSVQISVSPSQRPTNPVKVSQGGSRYVLSGNKLIINNPSNQANTPTTTIAGRSGTTGGSSVILLVRNQSGGQQPVRIVTNSIPVVKKVLNFGGDASSTPTTPVRVSTTRPILPAPTEGRNVSSKFGGNNNLTPTNPYLTPSSPYVKAYATYPKPQENSTNSRRQIADEHGFVRGRGGGTFRHTVRRGGYRETPKYGGNKKRSPYDTTTDDVNFDEENGEYGDEYDDEMEEEDDDTFVFNTSNFSSEANYYRTLPSKGGPYARKSNNRRSWKNDAASSSEFASPKPKYVRPRKPKSDENKLNQKTKQEVSRLLDYLVLKVCEQERNEKRQEKLAMNTELRRQYWKRYRVKRKIKLQYEDQISNRLARWRKEVLKRRQFLEHESIAVAENDLEDGGLEALKAAKEERRQKRSMTPSAVFAVKKPKRTSSEALKTKKVSRMKLSTSSVALDVGHVRKGPLLNQTAPTTTTYAAPVIEEKPRDTMPDTSCICKKPYDPTKFYVGCDLCSRYFHGKCVGVTAQISKRLSSWYCPDCQRERQNAKQELYCICRTPYDESQFYISCDCCDQWFHGACVGITPDEGEDIPAFICQECSRTQSGTIQPMIKPLNNTDVQRAGKVVDLLEKHKMSWPFRRPLDPVRHPQYERIVQEPMDLSLLKRKLFDHRYRCLAEFTNDVSLIFNNARKYYSPDSPEFQCATVLDRYFSDRLHELKQEMVRDLQT